MKRANYVVIIKKKYTQFTPQKGARLLARALLVNKKLAALSVQHCNLGDRAAEDFAGVMARQAEMTHDEIMTWRKAHTGLSL